MNQVELAMSIAVAGLLIGAGFKAMPLLEGAETLRGTALIDSAIHSTVLYQRMRGHLPGDEPMAGKKWDGVDGVTAGNGNGRIEPGEDALADLIGAGLVPAERCRRIDGAWSLSLPFGGTAVLRYAPPPSSIGWGYERNDGTARNVLLLEGVPTRFAVHILDQRTGGQVGGPVQADPDPRTLASPPETVDLYFALQR